MLFSQNEKIIASEDPNLEWLVNIGVNFDKNDVIFTQLSHKIQENLDKWRKTAEKADIHCAKDSIKPYFSSPSLLYKWLSPPEGSQHSLVQILSRDKKFQNTIFELICNFLTLTAFDLTSNNNIRKLVELIIKSLSFPPKIYDKDHIVNLVFDAISNTHETLQPILIRSLHTIMDPTIDAINRLINIMIEKPRLIQDALTALEGFQLTKEETENVRKHVLNDILSSASSTDLQAVIRFLVSTTDDTNASKTIESFRKSLVIFHHNNKNQLNIRKNGTLSVDDSNTFFVIQLKSALQFNQSFSRAYSTILENKPDEMVTLDYWVLYCMYGIPAQKSIAEKLIMKLCSDDTMTGEAARESIIGHINALEILFDSITDLISWCLGTSKGGSSDNSTKSLSAAESGNSIADKLADIGTSLALTMFEEVQNVTTQQNIVGSLLMQIGIGSDDNKRKAANVLSSLDEKKLRTHLTLISGILPSYDSIPLSVFKVIISVIVKLEFADGPEQGSQLHIFVSKMLTSTKKTAKDVGVVTAAAILNRYAHFNDLDAIQIQFNSMMLVISDDPIALNQFYGELSNNENRGKIFNEFLIENLTKQFASIITERAKTNSQINNEENNGDESPLSDWFSLDESIDSSLDFISGISGTVQKKKTLSIQNYRKAVLSTNLPIVFTHSGLKLLLDCHVALEHELEDVFGKYFKMPFKMFVVESNDLTNVQRVQALLYVHSYILETLNYFGPKKTKECIQRMENRYEIERLLIMYLSDFKVFNHPFFGEMFPKCNTTVKNANKTPDPSAFFVSRYRSYFNAPRLEYIDLLFSLSLPIDDESCPVCIRLLDDYLYLIKPSKSQMTSPLFECKKVNQPPLSIITFISNDLLDSVLNDEVQSEAVEAIVDKIFLIINAQILLPVYRDKKAFVPLMMAICGKKNQQEAFRYFFSKVKDNMKIETTVSLVELLKSLLHCGTSSRAMFDLYGTEMKNLCNLCRILLKSQKLQKNYVKQVLPIFFDHNPKILDEVDDLIKNVINKEIFNNEENEEWKSLTKDTFDIYFNQCFKLLNIKMAEIGKNLKSNKVQFLDEETMNILITRMVNLASQMRFLLMKISTPNVPPSIHQKVIQLGPNWMDSCTDLLVFLKDARNVYTEKVDEFIGFIRTIRRNLQAVVGHARNNQPKLQRFLPRITKSLETWSYSLRTTFEEVYDDLKLDHMHERTIEGVAV